MRVLIATPLYPPEIGGPATYAEILKQAWGDDALLVKFSDVRKYPKIVRHLLYFRMVLKAARNADVVLALDPVSVGLPAMKAAQKAGKKFVVKIVGDYAWEQGVQRFGVTQTLDDFVKTRQPSFAVRRLQEIQTKVVQAAIRIIVPSEYLQEIVMQWGISKEKIFVINNGIKLPEHIPTQQKKEGEFLIVSAGRRVPWKGFEAIERVAQSHPNWRVQILTDRPREEVLSWIKTAHVFVLNSQYEGFSHVLVEAMTLGTPVVVTNIRANKSLVGDAGLLIPPGDGTALEQALIEVERDPKEAQDRARAGQERMKSFEVSYTLDLTTSLLKSL
ncbi:MAG: glycosyltransferase family 4 protein [bacterium]|nr:glycosyltransferase family 4 protein [bacterium]